jgi:hypothetical protein
MMDLRELVEWLLTNLDDRSSGDHALKELWFEKAAELKSQRPKAWDRLFMITDGSSADKFCQDVDGFVEFILTGKRKRKIEALMPMGAHEPWNEDTLAVARELTYEGAKERLGLIMSFKKPSDYDSYLLNVAQTYILELLIKVWYLAFKGSKSSGKTTATIAWAYLGDQVYHVGVGTAAALVTIMKLGHGVSLDEVDKALRREEKDLIEALLCQGVERGQPYVKMVESRSEDGQREFVPFPVPTFGPKAFNFAGRLDDMLVSRADRIDMPRNRDAAMRRRARRFRKHLAPVKAWLELEAERALANWTPSKVEEYEDSEEFVKLSDSFQAELPRTGDIGDLMLIVGHIMGWPVEKVIQDRLDEIGLDVAEDLSEELVDIILRLTEETQQRKDGFWRIKTSEIRKEVKKLFEAGMSHAGEKFWDGNYKRMLDDLDLKRDRDCTEPKRPMVLLISDDDKKRLRSRFVPAERETADKTAHSTHIPHTLDSGVWSGGQHDEIPHTPDTPSTPGGVVASPSLSRLPKIDRNIGTLVCGDPPKVCGVRGVSAPSVTPHTQKHVSVKCVESATKNQSLDSLQAQMFKEKVNHLQRRACIGNFEHEVAILERSIKIVAEVKGNGDQVSAFSLRKDLSAEFPRHPDTALRLVDGYYPEIVELGSLLNDIRKSGGQP